MKAHTGQRTAESLFWLLALPLKHRDAEEKGLDVVDEDRNMLYSFIKDKLSVSQSLAQVYRFDFPTFKVVATPRLRPAVAAALPPDGGCLFGGGARQLPLTRPALPRRLGRSTCSSRSGRR